MKRVDGCIVDTRRRMEIDGEDWSAKGEQRMKKERRTCTTHCACRGEMQVQTTKLKRTGSTASRRRTGVPLSGGMSVATSAGDSLGLTLTLAPNAFPVPGVRLHPPSHSVTSVTARHRGHLCHNTHPLSFLPCSFPLVAICAQPQQQLHHVFLLIFRHHAQACWPTIPAHEIAQHRASAVPRVPQASFPALGVRRNLKSKHPVSLTN